MSEVLGGACKEGQVRSRSQEFITEPNAWPILVHQKLTDLPLPHLIAFSMDQ